MFAFAKTTNKYTHTQLEVLVSSSEYRSPKWHTSAINNSYLRPFHLPLKPSGSASLFLDGFKLAGNYACHNHLIMLPSNMLQSPRRHHCQDQCAPIWWSALWEREIASSSLWISDSIVLFRKATCSLMYRDGASHFWEHFSVGWKRASVGVNMNQIWNTKQQTFCRRVRVLYVCKKKKKKKHRTAYCLYLGLGILLVYTDILYSCSVSRTFPDFSFVLGSGKFIVTTGNF